MINQEEFIRETLEKLTRNNHRVLISGINYLGVLIAKKILEIGMSNNIVGFCDPISANEISSILGIRVYQLNVLDTLSFDEIIIPYDAEKEEVLIALNQVLSKTSNIRLYGDKNYDFKDKTYFEILSSLHVKSKAGGYVNMLPHIYQSLSYIVQNKIQGDLLELGTFRGGTTVFMAKVLKELGGKQTIYSFDTFSGFPGKKSNLDIFDEIEYEYSDYETVRRYCSDYSIKLIKGDIVSTIDSLPSKKIAFAFFDTDNYTATKVALDKIYDRISPGGVIAFDHYYSKDWIKTIGERIAAKEILSNKKLFHLHGTGIFLKINN